MTARREKQLNAWLNKNRRLVEETGDEKERDYIVFMWAGFLAGLRMTNTINQMEYNAYYEDLKSLVDELEGQRAQEVNRH